MIALAWAVGAAIVMGGALTVLMQRRPHMDRSRYEKTVLTVAVAVPLILLALGSEGFLDPISTTAAAFAALAVAFAMRPFRRTTT